MVSQGDQRKKEAPSILCPPSSAGTGKSIRAAEI